MVLRDMLKILSGIIMMVLLVYTGMVYGYLYSLKAAYEWNADTLRIIYSIDRSITKKTDCTNCREIMDFYTDSHILALNGLYESIEPIGFWDTFVSPGVVISSVLFEEAEVIPAREIIPI